MKNEKRNETEELVNEYENREKSNKTEQPIYTFRKQMIKDVSNQAKNVYTLI